MLHKRKHGFENQGMDTRVVLFTIAPDVLLRDFVFSILEWLGFAELKFPCPKETHTQDPTEVQVIVVLENFGLLMGGDQEVSKKSPFWQ